MLGLAALVGHLIGDYTLQTTHMARYKHINLDVVCKHALLYSGAVFFALWVGGLFLPLWAVAVVFVSHIAIDWYRLGVLSWQISNGETWKEPPRWLSYVHDNTIHLLILLVVLAVVT
jgi:hypothetical protein